MGRILIRGGTLVTMNPGREVYDGDLIIEDRKISALRSDMGQPESIYNENLFDLVINAAGKVVMPGLIQTHVHLSQTLFRGQADDLELMDWLRRRIWPLEAAHDPESMFYSAMLGCAELIQGGTTCIMDMEAVRHTDSAIEAINASGIRATAGKVMMDDHKDSPRGLQETTEESIDESLQLLKKWHGHDHGRIRYAFQPRFAVSCTSKLLTKVGRMAREYGVMIHSHASENQSEIELIRREHHLSNIAYLHKMGLTGKNVLLAHCIHLEEGDFEILADTGTRVAHCPSSNLKLGSGIARVPEMLEKGITVTLGADGAPCANNLDIFMEMRLAALIHKVRYGGRAMPAGTVLEMATIGGARALGLENQIGSLEVGKLADVIIVDLGDIHSRPHTGVDIASQLVYAARGSDVQSVIIDGRPVMLDRKLVTINKSEIIPTCERIIAEKLKLLG